MPALPNTSSRTSMPPAMAQLTTSSAIPPFSKRSTITAVSSVSPRHLSAHFRTPASAYTRLIRDPMNHSMAKIPWMPMSMTAPPPVASESQNQSLWNGPLCTSLARSSRIFPRPPSSMIDLVRTMLGLNRTFSPYTAMAPALRAARDDLPRPRRRCAPAASRS